jgi:DNA-binding transcriptional LysR family regulator
MDTDALRTFLTICRSGGFSSAAEQLNRSQPAISRRIALLEERLGAPLFERTTGGIVLSQAGQVLLPHAQRVLAALEDCDAAIDGLLSGSTGPVSLALVGTLASAALTPVLQRFARDHPGVDLRLRTATSAEVSDLVRSGAASIGMRYHRDDSPDVDCVALASERLQIVCAPEHALAGSTVNSLRRLAKERWLAFPSAKTLPETAANNLFTQFAMLGIHEVDWAPVDSLTAQKRLVEAGYGLAVLPANAIGEELAAKTLATIAVSKIELGNPIYLVTRRGGYLSPATNALVALLKTM